MNCSAQAESLDILQVTITSHEFRKLGQYRVHIYNLQFMKNSQTLYIIFFLLSKFEDIWVCMRTLHKYKALMHSEMFSATRYF